MKADVPPLTHAPELDVPAWVPESVAQGIRANYARDVHRAYVAALKESGDEPDADVADALAEDDGIRAAYAEIIREDLADIVEEYRPPRLQSTNARRMA